MAKNTPNFEGINEMFRKLFDNADYYDDLAEKSKPNGGAWKEYRKIANRIHHRIDDMDRLLGYCGYRRVRTDEDTNNSIFERIE